MVFFLQRSVRYNRGYHLAQRLGVSSHLVSRLTGSIYVRSGSSSDELKNMQSSRTNIGFNLKFNKTNKEVPGFSRKDPNDGQWLYSHRTLECIESYMMAFPELFDFLSTHAAEDNFLADDVFGRGLGSVESSTIVQVQGLTRALQTVVFIFQ